MWSQQPRKRSSFARLTKWFSRETIDPELQRQKGEYRARPRLGRSKENVLHFACSKGYLLLLEHAIQERGLGDWINDLNRQQLSPLEIAVQSGHDDCVRALLSHGEVLRLRRFLPTLDIAGQNNDLDMIRVLLDSPTATNSLPSLNDPDCAECTTYRALDEGRYEVARELLDFEFKCRRLDRDGQSMISTPSPVLTRALKTVLGRAPDVRLWKEIADLLLMKGALRDGDFTAMVDNYKHVLCARVKVADEVRLDYLLQNLAFDTPDLKQITLRAALDRAMKPDAKKGPKALVRHAMVKMLLDHGLDIDYECDPKMAPLFLAWASEDIPLFQLLLAKTPSSRTKEEDPAYMIFEDAMKQGKTDIIQLLLDHDPGLPNVRPFPHRETWLMEAAKDGRVGSAKCLLQSGALVDEQDEDGNTALHHAANNGRAAVISLLLDAGAECARVNSDDLFPVHLAVKAGDFESYKVLVQADSSFIREDYLLGLFLFAIGPPGTEYEPILHDVLKRFRPDVDFVIDPSCAATPLLLAARDGKATTTSLLLEHGADPNFKCRPPILWLALMESHLDVAQRLVLGGADVNAKGGSETDFSLLHVACQKRAVEVVGALLERGADPNARTSDGILPLHIAITLDELPLARVLLQKGADCNLHTQHSCCLELALRSRNQEIVILLLQHGADPSAVPGYAARCRARNWTRAEVQVRGIIDAQPSSKTPESPVPAGSRRLAPSLLGLRATHAKVGVRLPRESYSQQHDYSPYPARGGYLAKEQRHDYGSSGSSEESHVLCGIGRDFAPFCRSDDEECLYWTKYRYRLIFPEVTKWAEDGAFDSKR